MERRAAAHARALRSNLISSLDEADLYGPARGFNFRPKLWDFDFSTPFREIYLTTHESFGI